MNEATISERSDEKDDEKCANVWDTKQNRMKGKRRKTIIEGYLLMFGW